MDIQESEPLLETYINTFCELWTPTIEGNYTAHQWFRFGCPRDGTATCNIHSQQKTSNSQSWHDTDSLLMCLINLNDKYLLSAKPISKYLL